MLHNNIMPFVQKETCWKDVKQRGPNLEHETAYSSADICSHFFSLLFQEWDRISQRCRRRFARNLIF